MKVCTNNMICFRETTIIIILVVLIFIVIFIYQSYTMSKYKYMEKVVLNNNPLDSAIIVDNSNTCEDTLFNAAEQNAGFDVINGSVRIEIDKAGNLIYRTTGDAEQGVETPSNE